MFLFWKTESRRADSLLYGKISENISTLGAAGIRVPGSAGETCGTLEEDGIPSLVMADGPAGIRLRQWYEVDKETDSIYEMWSS